ncbi:MAG: hypothetical protein R2824_03765 [Saprospiraceae bacterium]|nr:hypothetical protein [Lewinella sp.]
MKELDFNSNGYLSPYHPIDSNTDSLEHYFVANFPNSRTRKKLFQNYQQYTSRFSQEIYPYFEQWIDGSFVSLKENPNDIDIVTFLDYKIFNLRAYKLDDFLSFSLESEGIDAYIVPIYPENHPFYSKGRQLKTQWLDRFSSTKADIFDNIHPKGFLSINFSGEQ